MRWVAPVLASVVGLTFGFSVGLMLLPDQPGIEVNQNQFANHWPFEAGEARLRCEGKGAVILTVAGTDYAVTGWRHLIATAQSRPLSSILRSISDRSSHAV
jgi:hypothetical protein